VEGAEEWARARIEEVERSNAVLLRKGREDARMLQGRELELQIFDKRLAKAGSRVEILEVLLQDTRNKYTKLKMQVAFLPPVLLGLIAIKPGLHGFLIFWSLDASLARQAQGISAPSDGPGRGRTARPIKGGGRKAYYQLRVLTLPHPSRKYQNKQLSTIFKLIK
jgi:hypothetical protein